MPEVHFKDLAEERGVWRQAITHLPCIAILRHGVPFVDG